MRLVEERPEELTLAAACCAVDLPRATYYRARSSADQTARPRRSPRRLSDAERQSRAGLD